MELKYNIMDDDTIAITRGQWHIARKNLDIVIPTQINNKPVTFIEDRVFQDYGLTSIIFSDTLTKIGNYALYFNKLTSIQLPSTLTSIEYSTFSYNYLTHVYFPNTLTKISGDAFSYNQLTSLKIPNTVIIIESRAFQYNRLTSIILPNTITSIRQNAFCGNLLHYIVCDDKWKDPSRKIFDPNINVDALNRTFIQQYICPLLQTKIYNRYICFDILQYIIPCKEILLDIARIKKN